MSITGNNTNDRLVVNGTATLGGTLATAITAGVAINTNWSWTLISGQRQQKFDRVNQPGGFWFSAPTYNQGSVQVQNPDIQVPGPQITNANVPLIFSAANNNLIVIPDPDAGSALLQITLSVTNGTLSLSGTSGLTFSSGSGSGDTTMTFVGTIDDINAALDGLEFSPTANYYRRRLVGNHRGGHARLRGAYSDNKTVPISVAIPTVTSLSPTTGITMGENTVTITGTGFNAATFVYFGTNSASFTVNSDTSISATVPFGLHRHRQRDRRIDERNLARPARLPIQLHQFRAVGNNPAEKSAGGRELFLYLPRIGFRLPGFAK